jgi:acyl carrier protein
MKQTRDEIFTTICDIAKDYVPEGQKVEFKLDSPISSASGIDSMSFIVIITRLETIYNLEMPNRVMNKMHVLSDVVDYIEKKAK